MEGIYLVNKIAGITSYDVVREYKKKTNLKVGHAGTLDPFAEGLLILLMGRATKLSDTFINENKVYEGIIKFGFSTDTYDLTGNIVNKLDNFKIEEKILDNAIKSLSGHVKQTPPIYSSIKVKGKKLYKYAWKNEAVEIPERDVYINFLKYELKDDELYFKVEVSKGTYIRSISNDLGEIIGVPCHLKYLKRLSSGLFKLGEETKFISLIDYAKSLKSITIKPYLEPLVLNGIYLDERQTKLTCMFSVYTLDNRLLAIYEPFKDKYRPLIIFGENKWN